MTLDDMQTLWLKYDEKLDAALQFNARVARTLVLGKVETLLGRFATTLRLEVAFNALAVFLIGGVLAAYAGERMVEAAAVCLDMYAVAIVAASIAQLIMLGRIDYDAPVVTVKRSLQRLEMQRARALMFTLLFAPFMWTPLSIVAARAIFGIDLIAAFGIAWIAVNLTFGVAVLAIAVVVARRYGTQISSSNLFRRTMDALTGTQVRQAAARLQALRHYESAEECI